MMAGDPYLKQRIEMVDMLKKQKIIISNNVYEAMRKVPRHLFVPEEVQAYAYKDSPQKIGFQQTISAPHMNAMMCEYLEIEFGQKILEIGTGSGYHASLLSELTSSIGQVYTIERIKDLGEKAKRILFDLNYNNISVIIGDGTLGLPEYAPFDRILVTAASPKINRNLLLQLSSDDGILCIPVGKRNSDQELLVIQRKGDNYIKRKVCGVIFVPLIGEKGFKS